LGNLFKLTCVFYNDNKITGIRDIPLAIDAAGKKSYAGFEEIRKYIQQMKQRGLPAEVFDGIDKYQSFISGHQLLIAEWNIIKGIKSGETNIESFFRQNTTS
jgi:2-methylisocitrate lyase-like PEP mutase family enzyme